MWRSKKCIFKLIVTISKQMDGCINSNRKANIYNSLILSEHPTLTRTAYRRTRTHSWMIPGTNWESLPGNISRTTSSASTTRSFLSDFATSAADHRIPRQSWASRRSDSLSWSRTTCQKFVNGFDRVRIRRRCRPSRRNRFWNRWLRRR